MTRKDLEMKILKLDADKEYIIVINKNAGLSPEDLNRIVLDNRRVIFLLVNDINAIRMEELKDFEMFMDMKKKDESRR